MGQRTQAAAGCLTAIAGSGAGLAVWAAYAQGRFHPFEQGPRWRVLFVELPLCVGGGAAAGVLVWALVHRLLTARRAGPPDRG
ncbi:hypothetical protein ACVHNB_01110 [Streptomyces sp. YJ-C3]